MQTIFKYKLDDDMVNQEIYMPGDAKVIKVAFQEKTLTLWAIVDTDKIEERYFVQIYGTGWEVPSDEEYVDTVFDDPFVWHIFIKEDK